MQTSARPHRDPPVSNADRGFVARGGSGKRSLLRGLFALFVVTPSSQTVEHSDADALSAFPPEAPRSLPTPPAPSSSRPLGPRLGRLVLLLIGIVVLSGLTMLAIRRFPLPRVGPAEPQVGHLTIDTRRIKSEVLIDGERRGVTPLTLSLLPGAHTITVRSENDERVVPLTMAAGADVTQYFDMKAAAPPVVSGQVSVATEPPGAQVAVDGRPRGTSPLTVADLRAGEHKITVTSAAGAAERTVMVTAGGTASVVFSPSRVLGPVGGWLSIFAPFEVQIAENEEIIGSIGSSGASRIMLAAGRHDVVLTNAGLGFQEGRRIEVTPGKTAVLHVDAPKASVSVNARPWAEIVLDGNSIGQTPIANLLVGVGPHEMVFRHPQHGERKQTVVVTSKGPNRIAMDFTK
jgi:hypothetical protein